jgi:hypothetical protein
MSDPITLEDLILEAEHRYDRQYIREAYTARVTFDDFQLIKKLARERKNEEQERLK